MSSSGSLSSFSNCLLPLPSRLHSKINKTLMILAKSQGRQNQGELPVSFSATRWRGPAGRAERTPLFMSMHERFVSYKPLGLKQPSQATPVRKNVGEVCMGLAGKSPASRILMEGCSTRRRNWESGKMGLWTSFGNKALRPKACHVG